MASPGADQGHSNHSGKHTMALPSCPEDSHGRDNILHFSFAFYKLGESIGLNEITQEEIQLRFSYRMHILLN